MMRSCAASFSATSSIVTIYPPVRNLLRTKMMEHNTDMDRKTSDAGKTYHNNQDDAPMARYSVRLTAYHAEMARRLGYGSLSDGLRAALENFISNSAKCRKL